MKSFFVFVAAVVVLTILSCNSSQEKSEKKTKWLGQEFEEGLRLNPLPIELLYPGARGEKLQITADGKEEEIILSTMDSFEKVDNYYAKNLPNHGWGKVEEGSYKSLKKSSLYFANKNREAIINISLATEGKTEIVVLWRPEH